MHSGGSCAYQLLEVFQLKSPLTINIHASVLDVGLSQDRLERLEKVLDMF
jgi:hypothetical protein